MAVRGHARVRRLSRVLLLLTVLVAVLGVGATHALAADPGKTLRFTYGSGDTAHPYIVYVPRSYRASKPTPLLVMAHGCQTTAQQQMRANLYNGLAERKGFIVLYPDTNAGEDAQPGPLAHCWRFFDQNDWHRGSGDPAAIAGMTRAVMDHWNVDHRRVYLMGMSAGSFMTSIMAAAYPEIYAAVGIMAGGAYGDPSCLFTGPGIPVESSAQMAYDEMGSRARVVPRLVMGGDADQGVPPACADKALAQGLRTDNLAISGGQSQTHPISLTPASSRDVKAVDPGGYDSTVTSYRDRQGCLVGQRWLIHGMNHFWSGGSSNPKWANWTDPRGPSGAKISWRFLSRYTKGSTEMPCAERTPAP